MYSLSSPSLSSSNNAIKTYELVDMNGTGININLLSIQSKSPKKAAMEFHAYFIGKLRDDLSMEYFLNRTDIITIRKKGNNDKQKLYKFKIKRVKLNSPIDKKINGQIVSTKYGCQIRRM